MAEELDRPVFPPMSKFQRSIWMQPNHFWMIGGGRRVGKSTVCVMRGVDVAIHGGTSSWYCASEELADENWQNVCDFVEPWATRINRHSEGIVEFQNSIYGKGVFRRKSGFNKFAGRAGTSKLLIFDEIQLVTKTLYNRALPSILTTGGHVCGTLTPPETPKEYYQSMWIKDIIDSADKDGMPTDKRYRNWYVTRKPTEPQDVAFVRMMYEYTHGVCEQSVVDFYENNVHYKASTGYTQKGRNAAWTKYVNIAIDALDSDRDDLAEDYDREYNFKWEIDSRKLVYGGAINSSAARSDQYECDKSSPTYWFVDRGEGMGYHVLLFVNRIRVGERVVKDPTGDSEDTIAPVYAYRIFDEISTKDVISEGQMIQNALELTKKRKYRLPELVVYDVRAPGYRSEILNAGLTPSARNVGIEDGIRKVRRLAVKNLLQVHPRCTRLWQNLMNYSRDDKGYPIDDKDNDAADALRYGVWAVDALSGVPNDTASENREMVDDIAEELSAEPGAQEDGIMFLTF